MRKKINAMLCHVTCFFFVFNILFFHSISYAGEEVSTIEKGERAPFSGTLFNTEAAARLLIELESKGELCDIECDRKLEIKGAELKFEYDILKASKDSLQFKYDETLLIKNDQIKFLENQVKKPKVSGEVVFIIGVLSGVGIAMGSAYMLNQISK
jgi:hypothetical protein